MVVKIKTKSLSLDMALVVQSWENHRIKCMISIISRKQYRHLQLKLRLVLLEYLLYCILPNKINDTFHTLHIKQQNKNMKVLPSLVSKQRRL